MVREVVPECEACKRVLYAYRAHPGKLADLTEEQELELLKDWHRQGHPDLNAKARLL